MEGTQRFGSFGSSGEPLALAIQQLVASRVRPGEQLEDVFAGSAALATHRAELHERAVLPVDPEFVLSLWCWWPLKPEIPATAAERLYQVRREVFAGAAVDPSSQLFEATPDRILRLSLDELQVAQQSEEWFSTWLPW